jgi:hypothetical protein
MTEPGQVNVGITWTDSSFITHAGLVRRPPPGTEKEESDHGWENP